MKTSKVCFTANVGNGKSRNYICMLDQGIAVWANEIYDNHLEFPDSDSSRKEYAVINLCLNGRCEVALPGDHFVYMMPGFLSISAYKPMSGYHYPSSSYFGVEIAVDLSSIRKEGPAWLSSFGLTKTYLCGLLEKDGRLLMAEASAEAVRVGNNLYEALRKSDLSIESYRFLTAQMLYVLKNGGASDVKNVCYATKGQRLIANETEKRITEDFGRHYTVEELAASFGISPSALKKYFETVYGLPVSHYLRQKRMEKAEELLCETDMSIREIALSCGYENQGKFGGAFRAVTGVLPMEYRRQHCKERISK